MYFTLQIGLKGIRRPHRRTNFCYPVSLIPRGLSIYRRATRSFSPICSLNSDTYVSFFAKSTTTKYSMESSMESSTSTGDFIIKGPPSKSQAPPTCLHDRNCWYRSHFALDCSIVPITPRHASTTFEYHLLILWHSAITTR